MTAIRQMALPFTHEPGYDPADFLADASNAEALAWLEAPWPGGRLAVWGGAGCGKTHLLHVWAARTGAAVVPGPALASPVGGVGLAIDDADAAEERALLHQLNAAAEAGCPVLLAARLAPSRWPTRLPDLASRLRATTAVEVAAPDEGMLATLFASLLAARQLAVPAALQQWLLLRLPREPAALREAAERLDRAAMAAGRRVTQGLAAEVLLGW
jgi:chromosomal replication initiation ATPase DnaA